MKKNLLLAGAAGFLIGLITGSIPPTMERIEKNNELVTCEHRATVAEVLNEEWCGPAPVKKISCDAGDLACWCRAIPNIEE